MAIRNVSRVDARAGRRGLPGATGRCWLILFVRAALVLGAVCVYDLVEGNSHVLTDALADRESRPLLTRQRVVLS